MRALLPTSLLAAGGLVLAALACAPAARPAVPAAGGAPTAPAPAASGPDERQALIAAARDEGQLVLVWSDTTIGGRKAAERLIEGFNRYYGLDLALQFTPGPPMPEMAAKIAQEAQAGRRASSDILLGTEGHMVAANEAGALVPVDYGWAENVRPDLVAPGGIAVEIASAMPSIVYNTQRVSDAEAPRALADLLKPEFKGRIAGTPYGALFDVLSSPEAWGRQRVLDYVTRLADQTSGLIRSGELDRIASGEFDVLALSSNDYDARARQAQGAPLAFAVPTDAPLVQYKYMAVPKTAAHPNAAKLWINYLLSREAQDVLYETSFADLNRLPGSKTAGPIEALKQSGAQPLEIDIPFLLRNDPQEMDDVRNEVQRILQKQR
ncbi:MAG TPA: ABC transporter substrate-binding protein [Chloroflexota bacterium]|nr:ABC transporter substrate-binding protein [Chloroflexota bacterium]